MLDARARRLLSPTLEATAERMACIGIPATAVTALGWLCGIGACLAVADQRWSTGLVLWLANRLLDGLDGPLARRHGATELGGFLDIVADFSIYAGFVLALAVAVPQARLACVALLSAYYLSGTAFLALSSLIERRGDEHGDERSLRFVGGLAEGTETVAVYVAFCLFPNHVTTMAWIFTTAVAVTAGQRVLFGVRLLRVPPAIPNHRRPPDRLEIR